MPEEDAAGPFEDAAEATPDKRRAAWASRYPRWALVAFPSTLVSGVLIGGLLAIFTPIATAAPSYSAMHDHLTSKNKTLNAQVERDDSTITAAEGIISDLKAAEQDVADRASALDAREAAVKSREDAITAKEKVVAANTIPGNGTFIVNRDIQPGQYRSEGGESCYWKRSDASGGTIDNYIGSGPAVVTVRASDATLETSRCAPFTKVG